MSIGLWIEFISFVLRYEYNFSEMKISKFWLLSLLLLIAACSTVAVTGRKQLNLVSNQEVLTASYQQYDEFMTTAPLSVDKAKIAMVEECGQKITSAVEQYFKDNGMSDRLSGYKWEFKLVKSDEVNAFCMPGGKIVFYEGILPYTQTMDGLAVVMGHEIAHAVARHSNERMSQQMLASVGSEVVGLSLSKKSELVQAIGVQVFGLGAELGIMLPYSRQHEYEADYLGLVFMAMAGYDPSYAVTFWERMSSGGKSTTDFLSTHPSDTKRIANIKSKLPEVEKYKK